MLIILLLTINNKNIVQQVIKKARNNLINQKQSDDYWNMPPWLGTLFLSQYYFQLQTLQLYNKSQFNSSYFTNKLINQQLQDGSWKQILQQNLNQGDLDCTIFNYWYLRQVNGPIQSIQKAKQFINSKGGIQNAQIMTKFKLATYGQYNWQKLYPIPLFLLRKDGLYSYTYIKDYVAQWVYPHLIPLAYLRYHKVYLNGSNVCLQQISSDKLPCYQRQHAPIIQHQGQSPQNIKILFKQMKLLQGKLGSIGAYTISTLLSLLSLHDYSLRYNYDQIHQYNKQLIPKAFNFIQMNYFNKRVPYDGSLDDGRWWDTILSVWALSQSKQFQQQQQQQITTKSIQYMIKQAVLKDGGIPYGLQFQYAPDLDDTAMLVMVMALDQKKQKFLNQIQKSVQFIMKMQNYDGGFGAFDKDKNDGQYLLYTLAFKISQIDKSAQIFDPSCADIVGHFLQAIGTSKLQYKYKTQIQRMIQFIKNNQNNEGGWMGRWGINYLYSFGAVISGLSRIGYNLKQQWLQKSKQYVILRQNIDGGWGQSTLSYKDPIKYGGKGKSTPTQTAWVLLGLLQFNDQSTKQPIQKAVKYLINQFNKNDRWIDKSVVGTGHRGVLYLQYPVYSYTFPLVALSRYYKLNLSQQKQIKYSIQQL